MEINVIAACDQNGLIGINGKLPWHLPDDLKRFREMTIGHTVIMGRKTYESIGRPLVGRTNFVVTSSFKHNGVKDMYQVMTFDIAISLAKSRPLQRIFVIGGVGMYHEALKTADTMYLTLVHTPREVRESDADVRYFPADISKLIACSGSPAIHSTHSYYTVDLKKYRDLLAEEVA